LGYEGWYPWQDSNLHQTVFETAASASWATGMYVGATGIEPVSEAYKVSALTIVLRADGASGGQRSRNLRDVDAALCRLSYAGIAGRAGEN
jgi:hypothetical protein